MSELGRLLVEARTALDLSLADVETATRVRQKYLEALEQGNYAALPPGAIARGFIRNYARFLGLDSHETLRLYTQESGDNGAAALLAGPGQPRPIDYRPLEVALMHEGDSGTRWWRWLAAVVLVAAIAVGVWWLLNNSGTVRADLPGNLLAALGPQRPTSTVTPTPTRTRSIATITPPVAPPGAIAQGAATMTLQPTATKGAADVSSGPTPTSDLLTLPIPTTRPTVTPTATPQPTTIPEPASGISLTLKITQRSWTKVTADGNMVMQELLEAGQERGWSANERISVLTGNAAGVIATVNGQELGAMGNVGQVVERTWSMDQDGNIADVVTGQPGADTATATP